jgi:hypothetical protein
VPNVITFVLPRVNCNAAARNLAPWSKRVYCSGAHPGLGLCLQTHLEAYAKAARFTCAHTKSTTSLVIEVRRGKASLLIPLR